MSPVDHQYELYLRATPEQVFAAIIDPAFTRQYFHGTAFDRPLVQGAAYQTSLVDGTLAVEGTVVELDPPRRLVLTWHPLYDAALAAEPAGRVEWQVEDAGNGVTRLRVVHTDLAQSPQTWVSVRHGWVWILDAMKTLLETGETLPRVDTDHLAADDAEDAEGSWHRMQAVQSNNSAWDLLDHERTPAEDEDLLRRAYAAAYHWDRAAGRTPENEARADWLLAKAQLQVGRPEISLHHAERCLATCERHQLVDFDLAYAHEARWRALRALGRQSEADLARSSARAVPIADPENRAAVESDLAS